MTTRTFGNLPRALLALAAVVAIGVAAWLRWDLHRMSSKVQAIDEYCQRARAALHDDLLDLESEDVQRRRIASGRIAYLPITYHGVLSAEMCVDTRRLPFPSYCLDEDDWPCLIDYARNVEQAMRARD